MSGTFPIATAKFETMGFSSKQNTISSKSINGKHLSRVVDNQRFGFTARVIVGKRSDIYGELMAFIIKQRSGKESFDIIPPDISSAKGNVSGTVLVNGTFAAGVTSVNVDGMTGTLKAGDLIKFASHTKIYMVVADSTADVSNEATLTIEPPLQSSISDDSVVTFDNVSFKVHLENDIQEFGVVGADKDGNALYQFEFDVEEAL